MEYAKRFADFCAAGDIENQHERDAVSARRRLDGVELWLARVHVADFENSHPRMKTNPVLRGKMKSLLEQGRARDMDEAYRLASR